MIWCPATRTAHRSSSRSSITVTMSRPHLSAMIAP